MSMNNTHYTTEKLVSASPVSTARLLTKSYVNTHTDTTSTKTQYKTVYPVWDQARKDGKVSEFVNLQTEERTTSTEILDQADKYAAGFLSLGLIQGVDCISIFGCLSNRTLSVWAGCLSIGIGSAHPNIFIPREKTIGTAVGVAKPKVIFVGDGCDGEIVTALASHFDKEKITPNSLTLPTVEKVFYEGSNADILRSYPFMQSLEDLIKSGETISEVQLQTARDNVKEDDATHIIFTSGSTGTPKCAQLDQQCLAKAAYDNTAPWPPVALVGGFSGDVAAAFNMSTSALAGNLEKVVLGPDQSDKEFGQICGEAIIKEKVKTLMLLATKLEAVSEYIEKHHQGKHEITLALLFGQMYTRTFREKIRRALGNAFVLTIYGMSECMVIGHSPFLPSEFEDLMDGKLIATSNIELRLVNGGEIVDIGEEGEVEAKAVLTFKGYRGEPEKTKQLFTEDRFLKTGDTAVMYPDGKFMIRGRASDAIRFKVERKVVWPAPIEEALSTHQSIHQIKVISSGLSDTVGDEVVYCIRLEEGAEEFTSDSVMEYCKLRGLTQLQFPRRVIYFDKLPVTVNDRKIDSRKLREEVLRRLENQPDLGKIQFNLDY